MKKSIRLTSNTITVNENEIYQISNISKLSTSILPRKISRKYSIPILLFLTVIGLILIFQSKSFSLGSAVSLLSIGMLIIDFATPNLKSLTLNMNDGKSESFTTPDSISLQKVEKLIQNLMDGRKDDGTESIINFYENKPIEILHQPIEILHQVTTFDSSVQATGNISGNIISGQAGKIIGGAISVGRDLLGKATTGSTTNSNSSDIFSASGVQVSEADIIKLLLKISDQVDSNISLSSPIKDDVKSEIKKLYSAIQNPQNDESKTLAQKSLWMLKGLFSSIKATNSLIDEFGKLESWVHQFLNF